MATLNDLRRTGVAYAALAQHAADEVYKMLVKVGIGAIGLTVLMWGINASGNERVNFIFFFAGVAMFVTWAFAPTRLLIAAGAGAAIQGLKDEDLTQGAVKGITTWYQVVLGVLLWFMITAGILSVLSFKARPGVFFPIVAMLLLITVAYAAVKNGTVKKLIAFFGGGVIVFNLWALVPSSWFEILPKTPAAVAQQQSKQPGITQGNAQWTTGVASSSNSGLPIGAWSQETAIPPGCSIRFSTPPGVRIQYRYLNRHWQEYAPGTSPNMSHVRFMVEVSGITEMPYVLRCS